MIYLVTISLVLALKVQTALSQCASNYSNITEAFAALDQNTYPVNQFTPGCVSQDCPSVSALPCPYDSSGSLNIAVLTQVLNSVQSCLSSHGTLCGVAVDPIPVCTIGLYLQPFLAPSGINGTLSVVPGSANITGLSSTTLTTDSSAYINVTITGLVYQGLIQGSLGLVGSDQVYTIDSVQFTANLNVSLVLTITTRPKVSVQVISKIITANAQLGQPWNEGPTQGPLSIFQTLIDWATQMALENSAVPNALGTFLGIIIANGIQTADSNCNSN